MKSSSTTIRRGSKLCEVGRVACVADVRIEGEGEKH